jgi:hypothetical protein
LVPLTTEALRSVVCDIMAMYQLLKVMLPDELNLYSRYPPATVITGDPVVVAAE